MKDLSREQLALHFCKIMNHDRKWSFLNTDSDLDEYWTFLKSYGWHEGYLRLADEVITKGYKP